MGDKRKLFIKVSLVAVIFVILCLLAVRHAVDTTDICKTVLAYNVKTGDEITVDINGTYYHYFLFNDHFIGTISVKDHFECTCDYNFDKNGEAHFTDEYGQPYGSIHQTEMFEKIEIVKDSENIYSNEL